MRYKLENCEREKVSILSLYLVILFISCNFERKKSELYEKSQNSEIISHKSVIISHILDFFSLKVYISQFGCFFSELRKANSEL